MATEAFDNKPYTFHNDSGHGWLQVPLSTCEGLEISPYSYRDATCAYLEEDCDAPLWMRHHHITGRQIRPLWHEGDCFVRGLAGYCEED